MAEWVKPTVWCLDRLWIPFQRLQPVQMFRLICWVCASLPLNRFGWVLALLKLRMKCLSRFMDYPDGHMCLLFMFWSASLMKAWLPVKSDFIAFVTNCVLRVETTFGIKTRIVLQVTNEAIWARIACCTRIIISTLEVFEAIYLFFRKCAFVDFRIDCFV